MNGRDNQEGTRKAHVVGKPESNAERQEQKHGNDNQEKQDGKSGGREQAHHLVDHVELHIFCLKPEIMFQHLNELCYGFCVLVARQHASILILR